MEWEHRAESYDNFEPSYVDLLNQLHSDVEKDAIMPEMTKNVALNLICRLENMLWPYSA